VGLFREEAGGIPRGQAWAPAANITGEDGTVFRNFWPRVEFRASHMGGTKIGNGGLEKQDGLFEGWEGVPVTGLFRSGGGNLGGVF